MKRRLVIPIYVVCVGICIFIIQKKFFSKDKKIPYIVQNQTTSSINEELKKGFKYHNFDLKIKIKWEVNKEKAPINRVVGSGEILTTFYFSPEGGPAMKNYGWAKITDYHFEGGSPTILSGEGMTNDTVSFDVYWDGKETITIKGVFFKPKTLTFTIDLPSPAKDVTSTDKQIYARLLGCFKDREFTLDISPGAKNYFSGITYDNNWHIADISFEIIDNGVITFQD